MSSITIAGTEGTEVMKEAFSLTCVKVTAPLEGAVSLGTEVPKAKTRLTEAVARRTDVSGQPELYGITLPGSIDDNGIHTYFLGVEFALQAEAGSEEWVRLNIPRQRYLKFTYKGAMAQCAEFYRSLFAWFGTQSHYRFDPDGIRIEIYGDRHNWEDKQTPDNELDIYIPVKE